MSDETKQVTAGEVRAAFPQCVAVADEFRAAFGDGVRLVYLNEGGKEIGTSAQSDDYVVTAAQMVLEPTPEETPKKKRWRDG